MPRPSWRRYTSAPRFSDAMRCSACCSWNPQSQRSENSASPVRHSECLTGDALFSLRCDCGFQLEHALQRIASEKRGALVYLRQEGRGIGLANKIRAYELQDQGADTVEANAHLGFGPDLREYGEAVAILKDLGVGKLRLLTNNPRKLNALTEGGLVVTERVPIECGRNPHNEGYLSAGLHDRKCSHQARRTATDHNYLTALRLVHGHLWQVRPFPRCDAAAVRAAGR